MKTFTIMLCDSTRREEIRGVNCFVGEDASGGFGILAGHARLMTALAVGLARFRVDSGNWRYLALPGALAYFHKDILSITTRKYLIDDDYTRIVQALSEQLAKEEAEIESLKKSLRRMEKEVFKRLWKMSRYRTGS